jgi:hypothetical protein
MRRFKARVRYGPLPVEPYAEPVIVNDWGEEIVLDGDWLDAGE